MIEKIALTLVLIHLYQNFTHVYLKICSLSSFPHHLLINEKFYKQYRHASLILIY